MSGLSLKVSAVVDDDVKVVQRYDDSPQAASSGPGPSKGEIVGINDQLQDQISVLQLSLLQRLITLNVGAFICGGALSIYLARRTLGPIEAAMDAQVRFSSDASHELRTPLTALRTRNEVALRKKDLTLSDARVVMQSSVDQTVRLEKLSTALLSLSRDDGSEPAEVFMLEDVANEAMNHVIDAAQIKEIQIVDAVPKLRASGSRQGITQVVSILLDNAIKYSGARQTIRIEGYLRGSSVFLSVIDQGPGIRATDLPHIFDRFYRADTSRAKHVNDGYGLGLAIARKIVEQHGGAILVASRLGKGSTFTMRLPAEL